MPRRELRHGHQVADWLEQLGAGLNEPGKMILIGSAALLWHAFDRGIQGELPEASMVVDPITDTEEIARVCYDCLIGSEFEREHGWHVNLMPELVLREFAPDWRDRAAMKSIGRLTLMVPSPEDLLRPKLRRGEPRIGSIGNGRVPLD